MKLEFVYTPVKDMRAALALYRGTLGFEEAWREGETTTSLKLPGSDVQLMLDVTPDLAPGPVFVVDSVADFRAEHREDLHFTQEPEEIPGGYLAAFSDGQGNVVYVLDQSTV